MRTSNKLFAAVLTIATVHAQEPAINADRAASTVILDQTGIDNLGIETELVEERTFESTVFAIGRIEEIPANHSVLSSRISGRVLEISVFEGDSVRKGDIIAKIESRVAGNPPPTISLEAPQSGIVTDSHVRVGEPVEPDVELLDISDRSQVWAVAKIPELAASKIKPGTRARIRVPALGDEIIEAVMVRYGVEADREAAAVEGVFVLQNADRRLQPGMRAEFSLVVGERKNVLAISRTAVQGDPARRVVFVEDFDLPDAFVRVPVVLGEQNDEYVEVRRGLFPADEVVTRGSYGLSFVGSGSGISLKEALDAAHGHEHNEDGSEITPAQQKAREAREQGGNSTGSDFAGPVAIGVIAWAALASILALVFAQKLWNRKAS